MGDGPPERARVRRGVYSNVMPLKHLAMLGAAAAIAVLLAAYVAFPAFAQPLALPRSGVELGPATRGDGGQNEIGAELFDALAALRTEELLAAHRLDGAEQLFTRAVDFGYSFSQEETFDRWGREEILGDFVRVIRMVRPDVMTSMSPEGQFGGQHHQASAILAREAFSAAGDPSRYPEQLTQGMRPWTARKFYHSDLFPPGFRRRSPPPEDMTEIDLSGFDRLLGRSYAEIGSHARSMHKCQGMPPLLMLPGPLVGRYRLIESSIPGLTGTEETSLFEGIDTSVESLVGFAGPQPPADLTTGLASVAQHAREAEQAFDGWSPDEVTTPVLMGLAAVRDLRARLVTLRLSDDAMWEIDFRLEAKERQFERAAVLAHGLRVEALSDDGVVTRGQTVTVDLSLANQGRSDVAVESVSILGFEPAARTCGGERVAAAGVYRCSSTVTLPSEASLTGIHWSREPGAARYLFEPNAPFGAPFRPTPFRVMLELEFGSTLVPVEVPVEFRYGDDLFAGEKRTPLHVVPRLAVDLTPSVAIIPSDGEALEVRVTVTNASRGPSEGQVSLDLPDAWTTAPSADTVRFEREDESRVVRFLVSPPGGHPGEHRIRAVVETPSRRFEHGYQVVEYPHTGRRHLVRSAEATITVLDIQMAPDLTVGYVEGVGDAVAPAIAQLGAQVEFIDADMLAWGDLSRFDVIVTGVRAYERRADLRAHNGRMLDYVEEGGTLIVQYNKFEFNDAQYGPRPAEVSRNRVTDEHAPIRVLATDHPVFGWPNPITESTWSGWVQERGLYFLGEKDPSYADLVELEDSFEWNPGVKRGALVELQHGEGRWVYVGLGLWRQLPAGTPGAYQLLANLISLGAPTNPGRR